MKKLLMILILTSCGSVEIPLFEEHLGDDHDHKGGSSKPAPQTQIYAATAFACGKQAYDMRCTSTLPSARILQPHELYDNQCYFGYSECLKGRR